MTVDQTWRVCKLFDLNDREIAAVRVPCSPMPPIVVTWADLTFVLSTRDGNYMQVHPFALPAVDAPEQSIGGKRGPFSKREP